MSLAHIYDISYKKTKFLSENVLLLGPSHSYICHVTPLIIIHDPYNLGLSSFKAFLSNNIQLNSGNATSLKTAIFRVFLKMAEFRAIFHLFAQLFS